MYLKRCLIVFCDCCIFPLFSFSSVCCNHPCCGAPDVPPLPPISGRGVGAALSFGSSQEEGSRGFVIFAVR